MKQYLKKRVRGFLIAQLPVHVLILTTLWIVSNFSAWKIFLIVYFVIIIGALLHEIFLAWRHKCESRYATQSDRVMLLVRDLIDHAYIYDEDHYLFYRKFLETVSVESLKDRGIIDIDAILLTTRYNKVSKEMTREDAELLALKEAGFGNRELKVIYGFTNINSVYIKYYRLKKRLGKKIDDIMDNKLN